MTSPPTVTRRIGIVLFDDVEELDAVGPWEVLAYWTRAFPQDGYSIQCLSLDARTVTAAKGLSIGAYAGLEESADPRSPHPSGRTRHPTPHR